MRTNWICGIGVSMLALVVGLAVNSASYAQATSTVPSAHQGQKAALIKQLRCAHKLLAEADHDYDGHRARAAEEVHKAIRDLEGKHRSTKVHTGTTITPPVVTTKPPHVKRPALREPQGTSDGQLRQALSILQTVQTELNGHHPKAAANVAAAVGQINTALSIK